jgi:tRNA nucleotidyltransferase (CCA-adding enzyme)
MEMFGVREGDMDRLLAAVSPQVAKVGRSFPVWKVWSEDMSAGEAIDVALPRREVKTGSRHTDFAVISDPTISFEAASLRRDFTMNALALDPLPGEVFDPHGGEGDLARGILRHVSPKFAEDPLRVLRGMQFAARFDLTASADTIALCSELTPQNLSSERLFDEWKKLLLKGKTPSRGLGFLRDTGWDRHFPEIAALKGVQQDPEWHPEGDVFTHTGHCLDAFAKRRTGDEARDLRIGFAVLCHDFGKATHTKFINGRWKSYGHEEAGEEPACRFLKRMTDQTELIHSVTALVGNHMVPHSLHHEAKLRDKVATMDASVRRLALRLGAQGTSIEDLCLVCACDKAGRPPLPEHSESVAWLEERAGGLSVTSAAPTPLLQGRDLIALGATPGVGFKAVLASAFERQLAGELTTRDDAVSFASTWLQSGPRPELPSPKLLSVTREVGS